MKFSPHRLTSSIIKNAHHVCITPGGEGIRITNVVSPQKSFNRLRTETIHFPATLQNVALVRRVNGRVATCEEEVPQRGT